VALSAKIFAAQRLTETPSLSDQVRNILLESLTSGHLRPGGRINEAELARVLGISRNPIREAVSGLAQRGFLVSAPRRGHFMRRFSPRDVNDVFSFRICVESFAIRQALPLMTQDDHKGMRNIVDRMIAAAQQRGEVRPDCSPQLAAWAVYGAFEEILTGWVLGQLPAGEEDVEHAVRIVVDVAEAGLAA